MEIFDYVPLYTWQSKPGYRVLVSTLEGGREQRKFKGRYPREWVLSFRADAATIRGIIAFFDARKGPFEAFSWIVPDTGETVSVRFGEESLSPSWNGTRSGEISKVVLKEVL
ncbi:hypothetical protein L2W58_12525 [Dethiosulfovibrio sp. F2B]|uniref:hypothetical protein n=1 Tax=Dethiosulfovibrio faecalis TaxID=2720018 RepID=UPI001F2436C3|nr:hypothetical protein [Dethiosulfovibrio faecalis]MCF4152622.1 hypothetical protein [Dethiosulfovibrio faecalis]